MAGKVAAAGGGGGASALEAAGRVINVSLNEALLASSSNGQALKAVVPSSKQQQPLEEYQTLKVRAEQTYGNFQKHAVAMQELMRVWRDLDAYYQAAEERQRKREAVLAAKDAMLLTRAQALDKREAAIPAAEEASKQRVEQQRNQVLAALEQDRRSWLAEREQILHKQQSQQRQAANEQQQEVVQTLAKQPQQMDATFSDALVLAISDVTMEQAAQLPEPEQNKEQKQEVVSAERMNVANPTQAEVDVVRVQHQASELVRVKLEKDREAQRQEEERAATEEQQQEQERLAKEKQEQQENEKLAKEKQEQQEKEKLAKEKQEQQEKEKLAKEKQEQQEKEKLAKEKQEQQEKEKLAKEKQEQQEKERLAKEKQEQQEKEREQQEKQRLAKEKLEQQEKERLAKEKQEQQEKERLAKEKMNKQDKERLAKEKQQQEHAAQQARELLQKREEQECAHKKRLEEERDRAAKYKQDEREREERQRHYEKEQAAKQRAEQDSAAKQQDRPPDLSKPARELPPPVMFTPLTSPGSQQPARATPEAPPSLQAELRDLIEYRRAERIPYVLHCNRQAGRTLLAAVQSALLAAPANDYERWRVVLVAVSCYVDQPCTHCSDGSEGSSMRRACLCVLQAALALAPTVPPPPPQLLTDAEAMGKLWLKRMAKSKISLDDPLDAEVFLHLLAAFGVAQRFSSDDVFRCALIASLRKPDTELCRAVLLNNRIPDLVRRLIQQVRHCDALQYVEAFGLQEQFPPAGVLKAYMAASADAKTELKAMRQVLRWVEAHPELSRELRPTLLQASIARLEAKSGPAQSPKKPAYKPMQGSKRPAQHASGSDQYHSRQQQQHHQPPPKRGRGGPPPGFSPPYNQPSNNWSGGNGAGGQHHHQQQPYRPNNFSPPLVEPYVPRALPGNHHAGPPNHRAAPYPPRTSPHNNFHSPF